MKTSFFNLDKSVNIQADHDSGNVVYLWALVNGRTKSLCDMVSLDRGLAIRDAIEYMLADGSVLSCVTTCGVNVYRGVTKWISIKKNGYENRIDYLQCLADDFGIDHSVVFELAALLGPSEDFDGLVAMLEDYYM